MRTKKLYANSRPRGGRPGQKVRTRWGSPGNYNRSAKQYHKIKDNYQYP